jgi:peptidoglycan/xylan/chitin deacetylase (PgdA/CDA1 family)
MLEIRFRPLFAAALAGLFFIGIPVLANDVTQTNTPATTEPKQVALTFDDGPYGTSTQQVLDILQKKHVPATFFVVGQNVAKYPELAKEIVQDGYEIGNHTFTHPHLSPNTLDVTLSEIASTDAIIASTTGVHTKLFRPPYGSLASTSKEAIEARGYTIVMWNVDPQDWDYKNSPAFRIIRRVLAHPKPKMIIVLHDGRDTHINYPRQNLIKALPRIIDALKARGYTFVTVSTILANYY